MVLYFLWVVFRSAERKNDLQRIENDQPANVLRSARRKKLRQNRYRTLCLLPLVMLALAGCTRAAPAPTEAPAFERPATPDPRGLGDPNAPIVLVEYSDFQCEFCASFERETKPQLEANYIKTGKVYFVYRDYPLAIHPGAKQA